jgi:ubiquinone/menaquinone biosynthesis C-methylase UbiE
MPDDIYVIPRLAALYDHFNPPGEDTAFYVELAGAQPLRALDLGCGTGQLACALVERGHAVTGVDPADAMLAVARNRPGGDWVSWIRGDARTLALGAQFDLIIMTGHVFQVFLGDDDVRAVLRSARQHLAPGGRLAFETRNPLVREWEEWMPDVWRGVAEIDGAGEVEVFYNVVSVVGSYVTFESHHCFRESGETLVSESTLRFLSQDEVARQLTAAGFKHVEWFGDWQGAPFDTHSREIIAVAR